MTSQMRRNAALMASVYPTILVFVSIALDFMEDFEINTSGWSYSLGWLVLFVNGFFRERRQALRKAERSTYLKEKRNW